LMHLMHLMRLVRLVRLVKRFLVTKPHTVTPPFQLDA
jgi:hypothetical protein